MVALNSVELIDKAISDNKMILVYFGNNTWGVCVDLKPKLLALLDNYEAIKFVYVDVEESHNVAIHYNIFTVPGILLYVDGKEFIREARHISMVELDNKINRYYNLLFE